VVKFYFASGSAAVADGAGHALADVVSGVTAGKKAVVSGFHDASGDPAKNAELSKQRAMAVAAALNAAGVPDDKIELRKPADATAGGDAAQAGRVEVTLE
jgi:K(+)-stimulated pyrophosphate-energized sodium pump